MRARRMGALLLAGTLALGACASDDEDSIRAANQGGSQASEQPSATEAPAEDATSDYALFEDDATGVTDTEIRFGLHLPLKLGSVDVESILGIKAVADAFWEKVNAAGGVNGRKVVVEYTDDGYDVNTAVNNCRQMLSQDVLFISGTGGADQIAACGNLALEAGIPYMSLGVSSKGYIDQPGYRSLTMTYEQNARLMAQYLMNNLKIGDAPVAFLRWNSPNGQGASEAFAEEMDKLGGNLVINDALDKQGNANEASAECLKMQQAGVEYVHMLIAPTVTRLVANSCDAAGYKPHYVTQSNSAACGTKPPLYPPTLEGCDRFQSVRTTVSTGALAQEARAAWKAANPDRDEPDDLFTYWGLFDVYREALTQAGPAPTRKSFLESLDKLDYDNGLFNPIKFDGSRVLGHGVVVERVGPNGTAKEVVSDWKTSF